MMKREDAAKKIIIDEYFKEKIDSNIELNNSSTVNEFSNKLNSAMAFMSNPDINNIQAVFDMESIINLAELTKLKQKQKKDIVLFVLIGLVLQFLMLIIAYKFGSKIILYFQIFLYANLPLLLIPFICKFNKGGSAV